jgi:hypothetical protein
LLQSAYQKAFDVPNDLLVASDAGWLNDGNVWVGFLAAPMLVNLYCTHGDALFFENIRDFLGEKSGQVAPDRRTVNEEIVETAVTAPGQNLERNNGITFRALEVSPEEGNQLRLSEGSIVNGCQTTMCLVRAFSRPEVDLSECLVQAKVVVSAEAWDVARSANYQNRVDHIDLVLAKYLRRQIVRKYALPAGVKLSDLENAPAISIVYWFYEATVR